MAKSNAQKCKEYRERRRAKLRAKKSPKKKTTTTTKDNPTSSTQRVKQFRLRKQRNTVNEIASHQLNLDSPNSFVKRNVELKPIPNVDLVDIKVKSEFINDFDNGCFESVNNECNGGQSSNNSGTGNYSNKIKEEHIEIEETIVKSEFNDRTYDEKCSIDNPIYSSTVNSEFSTKGNHTGHQSNLHCRNNFALVECNVDPKTVLDVDFDNIQVKSVFTNDFDNECFDSVNNEYNGGKSANLCDAGNDNIDIKDEHDIEITETIVKTEFNVSDCTYDEKCTIDNPNDSLIPPNIIEVAQVRILNLLPEKSRRKYEQTYKAFMDWRIRKNISSFSENVLIAYFGELADKFKSSTLWSNYSMIKTTLSAKNDVNIESYCKLKAMLKRKSEGHQPRKAKTFTPDEINNFITKAPDYAYLQAKVALIMGILGACSCQELRAMKITDVQDLGSAYLVRIPNAKNNVVRGFSITERFYKICKDYINLRPNGIQLESFFLNYQKGKIRAQKCGINKFSIMGKNIATFLKLPDPKLYTGHSFRRSSATLLVDAGGDITSLKDIVARGLHQWPKVT